RRRPPARRLPDARRRPARSGPSVFQGLKRQALADCGRAIARARSGRRLSGFLAVYLVLVALVALRLVSVQVVRAAEYRGLAARQTQRELEIPAPRGRLYDRNGEPLAMSLAASTVYANPRLIRAAAQRDPSISATAVATQLAPVLDMPVGQLVAELEKDQGFVYLGRRQRSRQVGEQVAALKLPGIGVLEEPKRLYPSGGVAAQAVGFVGIDNVGLAGLENQYEGLLGGQPGQLRLERAPGGVTINTAPREVLPAVPGADLVLTLDRELQHVTERALAAGVVRNQALGGSAVVLDARTGEILALASYPGYTPEAIGEARPYARRNRALTDMFEPGSVNKLITVAGALEEGVVRPESTFVVPDTYRLGPEVYHDASGHRAEVYTVGDIVERSSNIGTIKIAQQMGPHRLHEYMTRFGLGQLTGLGFPGESPGLLAPVDQWSASSLPTIAIGQGVAASLVQVAQGFAVIAAGGEWIQPSIVRGRLDQDGRVHPLSQPARRRVVSPRTAGAVAEMLVRVVEGKHGTGERAAVPGYRVAGKTGTAQKPSQTFRGYEPGAFVGSFVGFAPAENPALVVAVMLDEPSPHYGGLSAAPVFSEIMRSALANRRIPPSLLTPAPEPALAPLPEILTG
ncbi:MAG: peptidoglycan D,D-transpeptidase FtsI family protein, partial [Egibacteraceae bacterium]